ncbi:MAG: hypothetical protein ABIR18_13355 [Chitinophagaceae bacterium]
MKPKFYPLEAIIGLTVLSPILGCILFSYNLKEIGKGNLSPYFVIGGIGWILLVRKLCEGKINEPLYQLLIAGLSGALVMIYLWNTFLGSYPVYEKRKIWKPFLIFLGICIALIILQILL